MTFSVEPHTADVRLLVSGNSFAELVSESVRALMEVVEGHEKREPITREVKLSARDRTSLLVDFLGEVLALSHINREVYEKVEFNKVTEIELEAKLSGFRVESFTGDVKAVTYHEAEVTNDTGIWKITLVLDV